jgi:hypothetical protein
MKPTVSLSATLQAFVAQPQQRPENYARAFNKEKP